jgi:hypothetical protein
MTKTEIKHPDKTASTGVFGRLRWTDGSMSVVRPARHENGPGGGRTIEEQTRIRCLMSQDHQAAGAPSIRGEVYHLRDIKDFDAFNRVYASFHGCPSRSLQSVLWGTIKVRSTPSRLLK